MRDLGLKSNDPNRILRVSDMPPTTTVAVPYFAYNPNTGAYEWVQFPGVMGISNESGLSIDTQQQVLLGSDVAGATGLWWTEKYIGLGENSGLNFTDGTLATKVRFTGSKTYLADTTNEYWKGIRLGVSDQDPFSFGNYPYDALINGAILSIDGMGMQKSPLHIRTDNPYLMTADVDDTELKYSLYVQPSETYFHQGYNIFNPSIINKAKKDTYASGMNIAPLVGNGDNHYLSGNKLAVLANSLTKSYITGIGNVVNAPFFKGFVAGIDNLNGAEIAHENVLVVGNDNLNTAQLLGSRKTLIVGNENANLVSQSQGDLLSVGNQNFFNYTPLDLNGTILNLGHSNFGSPNTYNANTNIINVGTGNFLSSPSGQAYGKHIVLGNNTPAPTNYNGVSAIHIGTNNTTTNEQNKVIAIGNNVLKTSEFQNGILIGSETFNTGKAINSIVIGNGNTKNADNGSNYLQNSIILGKGNTITTTSPTNQNLLIGSDSSIVAGQFSNNTIIGKVNINTPGTINNSLFRLSDNAGISDMMWGNFATKKLSFFGGAPTQAYDFNSTFGGIRFPRLATGAVITPNSGTMLFDTSTSKMVYFDGTNWNYLSTAPTFGNGISSIGTNNYGLGGSLTQATTINAGTNTFRVDGNSQSTNIYVQNDRIGMTSYNLTTLKSSTFHLRNGNIVLGGIAQAGTEAAAAALGVEIGGLYYDFSKNIKIRTV